MTENTDANGEYETWLDVFPDGDEPDTIRLIGEYMIAESRVRQGRYKEAEANLRWIAAFMADDDDPIDYLSANPTKDEIETWVDTVRGTLNDMLVEYDLTPLYEKAEE